MPGPGLAETNAFVAILEQKSFAKAASQLGISRSRVSEMLPVAGRLRDASRLPQYFTRATLTFERAVTGVPNIARRPACILFEGETHVPLAPRHAERPDVRRSRAAAPKAAKRLDSRW